MDEVGETTQEWRRVLPLPAAGPKSGEDLLDAVGLDTRLARLLGQIGRLDFHTLRAALIRARSAGHVSLARALVLEGHLAAEEAHDFLDLLTNMSDSSELDITAADETRRGPAPIAQVEQTTWNEPWRAGSLIGGYRLEERLGSGAMGVVFRARDPNTAQAVAIKAIAPNADAEMIERFRREGEAQMRLPPHPHLVRVHATGTHEGRLYFVMDLVEGRDMREVLRGKERVEPIEAARLAAGIAHGLSHLHDHGVLHRDVKPANVVVDPDGRPLLVDFGIARISGQETITQSSIVLGTPSFMPPEQALGERERMGPRSDVYALSVLLYWLLTGQVPFKGSTPIHVLTLVSTAPPPRPRLLQPTIPAELEEIVLRNMAKSPDDRQTAAEFAAALEGYVLAATAPPPERRGMRTVTIGLLMVLGMALGAAGMNLLAARRDRPEATPTAASAPGPIAPPTTAVVAKPTPTAAPASIKLGFAFAPGARQRYELTTDTDMKVSRRGEPGTEIEIHCRLTFDLTPGRLAGDGRQPMTAHVRGLSLRWSLTSPTMTTSFEWDSHDKTPGPLEATLDEPFTFTLRPSTGAISDVAGVEAIQQKIFARTTQQERWRYRVPIFATPQTLTNQLGALLHVYPEHPTSTWVLEKPPADLLGNRSRQSDQSPAGGLLPLETPTLSVRCAEIDGKLSWEGSAKAKLDDYEWSPTAVAGRIARTFTVTTNATRSVKYTGDFSQRTPRRILLTDRWSTLRVLRSPGLTHEGKTYPAQTLRAPSATRARLLLRRIDAD